jgi:hypothetical protein
MSSIQKIIAGLQIFDKYNGDISADHDVIHATPNRMQDLQISAEDEAKLNELGWSYDSDIEAWYHFV